MSVRFHLCLLSWFLCLGSLVSGQTPPPGEADPTAVDPRLLEAWDQVNRMEFHAASASFEALYEQGGPHKRDAAYGLAAVLLNAPPRTPAQIDRAAGLFRDVKEADPDDETGIAAWFFLGRIPYRHRTPPDYPSAMAEFESLFAAHPDHRLAQFGLIKNMIIGLYLSFDEAEPEQRFREWDTMESRITDEAMVRSLCWTMGDAATNLVYDPQRAFHYYSRGESLGYSRHDIRAMMLLRVQFFAREIGDTETAIEALKAYQVEFPRSVHSQLVKEILEALEGKVDP